MCGGGGYGDGGGGGGGGTNVSVKTTHFHVLGSQTNFYSVQVILGHYTHEAAGGDVSLNSY